MKPSYLPRCAVAAVACALAACGGADGGGSPAAPQPPAVPAAIAVVSGSGQSAEIGSTFTQPLAVKVTDAAGRPVSGVSVTFTAAAGAATFGSGTTASDADGRATTTVTAGSVAGNVTVSAQASGVSTAASFVLTVTPRVPAAIAIVSGNNQTADPSELYTQLLTVKVTDAQGRGVPNIQVTFSKGTGVITILTDTVLTDAQGVAGVQARATQVFGVNTVVARAAGVTATVTFSLTIRPSQYAGSWSGQTVDRAIVFFKVNEFGNIDTVSTRVSWQTIGGTCTLTINGMPLTRSVTAGAFEADFSTSLLKITFSGTISGTSAVGSLKVVTKDILYSCGTSFFFQSAGTTLADKSWNATRF